MVVEHLIRAAASLRDDVGPIGSRLVSEGSVDVCYNPLEYAWDVHEAYLARMGGGGARTVVLGMNPGPHGMGQMGIPFAATSVVRELLDITGIPVSQPEAADLHQVATCQAVAQSTVGTQNAQHPSVTSAEMDRTHSRSSMRSLSSGIGVSGGFL